MFIYVLLTYWVFSKKKSRLFKRIGIIKTPLVIEFNSQTPIDLPAWFPYYQPTAEQCV